jgi:hypothetical protein
MKWRPVKNWRDSWRWISTSLAAVIGATPFVWSALPDDAKAWLPEEYRAFVFAVLAVALYIGRITDQGGNDA